MPLGCLWLSWADLGLPLGCLRIALGLPWAPLGHPLGSLWSSRSTCMSPLPNSGALGCLGTSSGPGLGQGGLDSFCRGSERSSTVIATKTNPRSPRSAGSSRSGVRSYSSQTRRARSIKLTNTERLGSSAITKTRLLRTTGKGQHNEIGAQLENLNQNGYGYIYIYIYV